MKEEKPKADAKAVAASAAVPVPAPATLLFGLDLPPMPALVLVVDKKLVEKIVERMKEL